MRLTGAVQHQRVTIRAGVGLRLGANIGYLAYSRKRNIIPF